MLAHCSSLEIELLFVCWFCTLQLCWLFLIDYWWSPSSFLCVKPWYLQIVKVLLLPLRFGCVFFLFFSPPLAWLLFARTFGITSNKSGDRGHPFLVPDFRGIAFDISPLSLMSAEGFSICDFYYVEVCSFFTHLIQS